MKNVVRLSLGMAALMAISFCLETQAEAGLFGGRGGCCRSRGHHRLFGGCHKSSCCEEQTSCCEEETSCCEQASNCGCEAEASCGCESSCDSGCGKKRHRLFGRHRGCGGCDSGCGGCGSGCGSSDCGCGGEEVEVQEAAPADAPQAPADEAAPAEQPAAPAAPAEAAAPSA